MEFFGLAQWDRIAMNRNDVAGIARKRPQPPAETAMRNKGALLGHPSGTGTFQRGEYLGDGKQATISSSVGRGQSKWVTPKEYVPWDGKTLLSTREQIQGNK